jgi:hypothetical protein
MRCPSCGQPISVDRAGVRLTPLKAAIFDQIRSAGAIGITSTEILGSELYRDRRRANHDTIKSHCWQINEQLADTPWVIVSDRRRWFLQRRKVRRAA